MFKRSLYLEVIKRREGKHGVSHETSPHIRRPMHFVRDSLDKWCYSIWFRRLVGRALSTVNRLHNCFFLLEMLQRNLQNRSQRGSTEKEIHRNLFIRRARWSYDTNHIEVEDICNNTNALLQTLVDLLLQEEYFFPPKLNNKTSQLVWYHSNIGYIFAIVPDAMSTLIKDYFSFTDVFKVCGPQKCDPRLTLRSVNDQALLMRSLLERFEWQDVLFVNFLVKLSDYDFWDTYFNKTIDRLKESETFCLKTKRLYNWIGFDYTEVSLNKSAIVSNSTAIVFYGSDNFVSSLFYMYLEDFFLQNYPRNPIIFPHLNHKVTYDEPYTPSDSLKNIPWLTHYEETKEISNVYHNAIHEWERTLFNHRYTYGRIQSLQKTLKTSLLSSGIPLQSPTTMTSQMTS